MAKINIRCNYFYFICKSILISILSLLINELQVNAQPFLPRPILPPNPFPDPEIESDPLLSEKWLTESKSLREILAEYDIFFELDPPGLKYRLYSPCESCSFYIGGSLYFPENLDQPPQPGVFLQFTWDIYAAPNKFLNTNLSVPQEQILKVPYILEDETNSGSSFSGYLNLGLSSSFNPTNLLSEFDEDNDGIYNFKSMENFSIFLHSSVNCPEPITGLIFAAGLGGAALKRAKNKSKKS